MEINKDSKHFIVVSDEPFGQLLLEVMYSRSVDDRVLVVQRHIGNMLVEAYLDDTIDYAENFGMLGEKIILHNDIGRDLAMKAEVHARNHEVTMTFNEVHFDGLEQLALREIKDLPGLMAEREIIGVALEIGYESASGHIIDEQDIAMIDEEITQAEASKVVIRILKELRESQ